MITGETCMKFESEAKVKTRVCFEELLKTHSDLICERKKLKKNIGKSKGKISLDTVRSSLQKIEDTKSEVVAANTNNPEKRFPVSKSKPSNSQSTAENPDGDISVEKDKKRKGK